MKKYVIIDQTTEDWFEESFDTEAEAIEKADYEWLTMTEYDKKRREAYFVGVCELDEDGCVNYDTLTVIKAYK